MSRLFKTQDDPIETVNDLFVRAHRKFYNIFRELMRLISLQLENEDYRVFFINSYTGPARKIICEVYSLLYK